MRRLALIGAVLAAAIGASASVAATPASVPSGLNPASTTGRTIGQVVRLVDGSDNQFDAGNPLPTGDVNGASFSRHVGPLVAGTDYSLWSNNGSASSAANSYFRAVEISCTASATIKWKDAADSQTYPFTLAAGSTYQAAHQVVLIDATTPVPAACTLYGLK